MACTGGGKWSWTANICFYGTKGTRASFLKIILLVGKFTVIRRLNIIIRNIDNTMALPFLYINHTRAILLSCTKPARENSDFINCYLETSFAVKLKRNRRDKSSFIVWQLRYSGWQLRYIYFHITQSGRLIDKRLDNAFPCSNYAEEHY